jgi:hypothetical protein
MELKIKDNRVRFADLPQFAIFQWELKIYVKRTYFNTPTENAQLVNTNDLRVFGPDCIVRFVGLYN